MRNGASRARFRFRAVVAIIASGIALTVTTGCSKDSAESPWRTQGKHLAGSFRDHIDEALRNPLIQDFERGVLERARESGRIEQADYDEAYSRYSQCMEAVGKPVRLKKLSNGLYRVDPSPKSDAESVEAYMQVENSCSKPTILFIANLYGIQQGNPKLLANPYEIAYRCLEAKSLLTPAFSFEEFVGQFQGPGSNGSKLDNLPFDAFDDEAQACFLGANMVIGKSGS